MKINNAGWEKIFDKLSILKYLEEHESFDIAAQQIKDISAREPRLMAKIDFIEQLPGIFRENGLSILAITNGKYKISKANPFRSIPEINNKHIKIIEAPENIKSIDPSRITSESQALDIAFLSGMLENVFQEDSSLTIRGRTFVEVPFNFILNNINFKIQGVQIEVDGGYEGEKAIHLIEAKIGNRTNLNLRQVLYPELYWQSKIKPFKIVKSYLLFYLEPIFRFIPFVKDSDNYYFDTTNESIFQFRMPSERFDLYEIKINEELINQQAPFPQADTFERVLYMLSYIKEDVASKQELFAQFDITDRQIDYYFNVLSWMGLCDYDGDTIKLTDEGLKISDLSHIDKLKELAGIVFSNRIFNIALHKGVDKVPENEFKKWRIGKSTINRRKITITAWINYFKQVLL